MREEGVDFIADADIRPAGDAGRGNARFVSETYQESRKRGPGGGLEPGGLDSSRTAESPVTFAARDPMYRMENLVLPAGTISQLRTLRARFTHHDLVYDTWGLGRVDPAGKHIAFNLYGLPGTGKTMCVEALAGEWGKKIIDVNYAEIESKYVGETGKNITAAFAAAKKQGAILFFDEADSILGQRMTSVTQAADQAVNVARAVMLKQLDAFDGIVAFATNLAKNFDSAFVRRIPIHIEIPLPDKEGRLRILETLVPNAVPFRNKIRFQELAENTDGMAGGDLKNVIVNGVCEIAAMEWMTATEDELASVFLSQIGQVARARRSVGRCVTVKEEIVPISEVK